MASSSRQPTSYSVTNSNRGPSGPSGLTTTTSRGNTARPRTSGRPKSAASVLAGEKDQNIICAISESRGISPTVGLAFVNVTTYEAVLCQICDSQTYVKTIHKLMVYGPTEVLFMSTTTNSSSKLFPIVQENVTSSKLTLVDRKYWAENTGIEFLHQLAFKEDLEALKVTLGGNYFATCCFAAVMRYIELSLSLTFAFHSLRIKYEPADGSMMIDLSTIVTFELIQNLRNTKCKDCLFGLLNETLTPMGSRILRGSILQPSTQAKILEQRYDALEELTMKEEMFYALRQALKNFVDADKILTTLITIPTVPTFQYAEQSINNVVMLKQYVISINPVYEALTGAMSSILQSCRELCRPANIETILKLINDTINEDTTYQTKPIDLRNQRTYAVRSGINGFLDVARQTYKEGSDDAYDRVAELADEYEMVLELKFEVARQYYIRIPTSELMERPIPDEFINVYHNKKSKSIECQTLELVKLNQKILDSHHEVIRMSDRSVQDLISDVRAELYVLFKISEAIAELDMIASFGQVVTTQDYTRPELTETLAIKSGRHPLYEKIHPSSKFIPNDVYATQNSRFQIITGYNMSGKSTYIRSIALITVMAQIGCFVPAQYASIPIRHHLFARVTASDAEISANVSTFSAEMREMAFILRNISPYNSMIIIDELGRGTATTDGLHIALAISEALLQSFSLVWFATHFHDLAKILAPRPGVVNMHLAVHMPDPQAAGSNGNNAAPTSSIKMLYKVSEGPVQSTHYGLALAQVVGLPDLLVDHATTVSEQLTRISAIKKEASTARAVAVAKRRKLIFSLNEQLRQARDSEMQGDELREWLATLKREFCMRMAGIEAVERIAGVIGDGGNVVESTKDDTNGASVVGETVPETVAESVTEQEPEEEAEGSIVTLQHYRYSESVIEVDREGEPVDRPEEEVEEKEGDADDEPEQDGDDDVKIKREGNIVPDDFFDEEEYEDEEYEEAEEEEREAFTADGDDYGADEEKDWMRSN